MPAVNSPGTVFYHPTLSSQEILDAVSMARAAYENTIHQPVIPDGWVPITIELADYGLDVSLLQGGGYFFQNQTEENWGTAEAVVFRNEVDPTRIAIAFRGTETENGYGDVADDFLGIRDHYDAFAPLFVSINNFLEDVSNNITDIVVTGHSLGGALTEIFMEQNPNEGAGGINYHAVAIASPEASLNDDDDRILNIGHQDDPVFSILGFQGGNDGNSTVNINVAFSTFASLDIALWEHYSLVYDHSVQTIFDSQFYDITTRTTNIVVSLTEDREQVRELTSNLFFDETNLILGRDASYTLPNGNVISADDYLVGGASDDYLEGFAGNDILEGDNSNVPGVGGNDTMAGGAGFDTFLGTPEDLDGDWIVDLEIGDMIEFAGVDYADIAGTFTYYGIDSNITLQFDEDPDSFGATYVQMNMDIPFGAHLELMAERPVATIAVVQTEFVGATLNNGLGGDAGFGEFFLGANDDSSTAEIDITSIFEGGLNFFGREFDSLWINNNGGVTFNGPRGAFTPTVITENNNNPEITPFFADVDTRGGPTEASFGGTSTGSNLVYYDFDTVSDSMTITWDDVGYYSQNTSLINAFQLILTDQGDGDFDIEFRYENIEWTTGDASDGIDGLGGTPARAGFTASTGDPDAYFELPASGDQDAILLLDEVAGNTGQVGIWEFSVRSGEINSGAIPELPDFRLTGATSGDPHLVTLDGVAYDFHAAGEYVLLRATDGTDFEVQSRMTPVEGSDNLTVNSAIALRAGGSNILIDSTDENPFNVDGGPTVVDNFASIDIGNDRVFRSNNVYTVVLAGTDGVVNDGDSQIEITVHNGRVDLVLSLNDELAGDLEGLLGDADGDRTNDVAFANGTPLLRPFAFEDIYGQYRDDWRVDDVANSLFTYDEGESLDGFYLADHPGSIANLSNYSEDQIAAATAALVAAGLVEGTVNFNNALLDFLATDDTSYIDAAGDVPTIMVDPDTEVRTAAELGRPTILDDRLVGTADDDYIDGLGGNDRIYGLAGNDDLRGSEGNDAIFGKNGEDIIRGGTGDDILKGGADNDILIGGIGVDLLVGNKGADILKGNGGADTMKGGAGADVLRGAAGDDVMSGGSGADKLIGGKGEDVLSGNNGKDILNGGAQNDVINGGKGNDKLTGGSGSDSFVFNNNHDRDNITDYNVNRDMLMLNSDLVGTTMSGSDIVSTYADVTADGVVFDFGDGNTITLEDLTSTWGLADSISVF